jgi:hypothetical protein
VLAENVVLPVGQRKQDPQQQSTPSSRGVKPLLRQQILPVVKERFDVLRGLAPVAAKPADLPDDDRVRVPREQPLHRDLKLRTVARLARLILVSEDLN